jgi:hypothetical protein
MKRMKVVRVTKEEFELEDGTVQPMIVDLGYVPTVEEFQQMLDESCKFAGIEVEEDKDASK